jgi:hypothetical protein
MASQVSFLPVYTDILIKKADNPTIPITVEDDTGAAVDITAATFTLAAAAMTTPLSVSGTIVSATDGTVNFALTTTETTDTLGPYLYTIKMVHPSLNERTLFEGDLIIK